MHFLVGNLVSNFTSRFTLTPDWTQKKEFGLKLISRDPGTQNVDKFMASIPILELTQRAPEKPVW